MVTYKRNQVEDAFGGLSGDGLGRPSTELLTRTKRLLDTDRALGLRSRSDEPELQRYAFFSSASPGKGAEVEFSNYEAFALLIGLQMLNHKWPQKYVVETLRRLRPTLQKQHRKILNQDPVKLFDERQIGLSARAGDLASVTTTPVFLLIWSDQGTSPCAEVFDDPGAAYARILEKAGRSSTWIELTRLAHVLSDQLSKSLPRNRGRS
jgi:hypothetical protein